MTKTDVLIIGSGLSGGIAALCLAKGGAKVTLVSSASGPFEENSSRAQGGIAYVGEADSADKFLEDIQIAGDHFSNVDAIKQLVELGPSYIDEILLNDLKVPFTKDSKGKYAFTKEAAHSSSRILYCKDQTGKAIMESVFRKIAKTSNINQLFDTSAVDLITLSHHSKNPSDIYLPQTCIGAYLLDHKTNQVSICFAQRTILATGGVGEVFLHSSNSKEARGDGIAMAYRAGVRIMNMEYVQFHPTTLYSNSSQRFLLTEALRGEGAVILDYNKKPLMKNYDDRGDLAPRDVVAKAMYDQMITNQAMHLWLDISFKDKKFLLDRFPHISKKCTEEGYDITSEPIPVVPAAHYMCGGIYVDLNGNTSMKNLSAIGEVSCTGIHGANRLASTSLLEALVWGRKCAEHLLCELSTDKVKFPKVEAWKMGKEDLDLALIHQDFMTIKQTMWNYVGLVRDKDRLLRALKMLGELKWQIDTFYSASKLSKELLGLRNGVETALLITKGALRNPKSKGCHYRVT